MPASAQTYMDEETLRASIFSDHITKHVEGAEADKALGTTVIIDEMRESYDKLFMPKLFQNEAGSVRQSLDRTMDCTRICEMPKEGFEEGK